MSLHVAADVLSECGWVSESEAGGRWQLFPSSSLKSLNSLTVMILSPLPGMEAGRRSRDGGVLLCGEGWGQRTLSVFLHHSLDREPILQISLCSGS